MAASSSTRTETAAVLAKWLSAMQRRDLEGLVELVSPDCVVESMLTGELRGRDGIRQVYQQWFSGFPDLVIHPQESVVDADRAVLFFSAAGTDTGGFMGLPPTGRSFRAHAALAMTVAGEQVVRYRSVYDFTGLLVQVGILKAKPV